MGLDNIKQGVKSFLEKNKVNSEEQAELDQGQELFRGAEEQIPTLDESVAGRVADVGYALRETRERLAQERSTLEEVRGDIKGQIDRGLAELMTAKSKMDAVSATRYGDVFADARRACNRCIKEYKLLLDQIDAEARMEPADSNSAMLSHVQREQALLQELLIQAESIGMLAVITPAQKAAVKAYSSTSDHNSYKTVNPFLRGQAKAADLNAESRETIINLHSLLSNCVTKSPVTVYRGVRSGTKMVQGGKSLDQFSDERLVGKKLIDGAFVSASTKKERAFKYNTILVLNLPKGTYGSFIGDISSAGMYESEFLMDCKQVFLVKKVERRGPFRYIYADSLRVKEDA